LWTPIVTRHNDNGNVPPPLQLNVVNIVVVVVVVVVLTAFDRDHHCGCRLVNTPSFQLTLAKVYAMLHL